MPAKAEDVETMMSEQRRRPGAYVTNINGGSLDERIASIAMSVTCNKLFMH